MSRKPFRVRGLVPAALVVLVGLSVPLGAPAQSTAQDTESTVIKGQIAPRLMNVGNLKHPITTRSTRAQIFFNQGFNLAFGFNHAEAFRAFQESARLDPECAMCYWGMALVLGPNINMPMPPEAESQAYTLLQKALALKGNASEKEQGYIEALAARYSGRPEDRQARDRAYADAMRRLHQRYPDDLDIATLFAESLMDLRPWNYWTRDWQPYPETLEILRLLESVLTRNPNHIGAIHYYIHSVELPKPYLAEAAAERLVGLAPAAGHLVHMPSHIFRRLGRYADASQSNELAILADEDYIAQCRAQGIYPLGYYPHNIHFLWDSASMEGRSRVALDAARKVGSKVTPEMLREMPILNTFAVVPLFSYIRFGQWDALLAEPKPAADFVYLTGVWHYARGLAYLGTDQPLKAAAELEALKGIAAGDSIQKEQVWSANKPAILLQIATEVLAGELAASQGDYEKAITHLLWGVLLEDSLEYIEPPDWPVPVRQSLGVVLLEAGRPQEAEVVYWEDLKRNPENGWSLFGLMQALRAQGKEEEAAAVGKRFERAWARADFKLTSSRILAPVRTAVSTSAR